MQSLCHKVDTKLNELKIKLTDFKNKIKTESNLDHINDNSKICIEYRREFYDKLLTS